MNLIPETSKPNTLPNRFYSHGKLLLTSEYLVLDGAEAIAIPCRFGQDLEFETNQTGCVHWKAYSNYQTIWGDFNFSMDLLDQPPEVETNSELKFLIKLLQTARKLNKSFLKNSPGISVNTHLEFPRDWGLGSSSTLIHNVALWAEVNPYELLSLTMGGSGYDIACAGATHPISFVINPGKTPLKIAAITLGETIQKQAVFIHLNSKQDSREAISAYLKQKESATFSLENSLKDINELSIQLATAKDTKQLEHCIRLHESFIGNIIQQTPVKERLFEDFKGAIKSLGGWGGDFIMAASDTLSTAEIKEYFLEKGYPTSFYYAEMMW
jgi:mevalonate kinase